MAPRPRRASSGATIGRERKFLSEHSCHRPLPSSRPRTDRLPPRRDKAGSVTGRSHSAVSGQARRTGCQKCGVELLDCKGVAGGSGPAHICRCRDGDPCGRAGAGTRAYEGMKRDLASFDSLGAAGRHGDRRTYGLYRAKVTLPSRQVVDRSRKSGTCRYRGFPLSIASGGSLWAPS
jgi:hypothetical protein